ncbi:hypothetical protein [Chondrinema litorale]|uniref:hypothetical protein n=1 Tax=Chondrinema litorale TaxID=2994555 RepID=UPI0025429880|nr:hypothetical protein [Chondrinema litorale]UZR99421.1 hypothetical protein OQ292_36750 [Chondrinema litorale]
MRKRWISLERNQYLKKVELDHIDTKLFSNLSYCLPPKIAITNEEESKLKELLLKDQWIGDEFLTMLRLKAKKGISPELFETYQVDLKVLEYSCSSLNFKLPESFQALFSNFEYLSRFRFFDVSFMLNEKIIPLLENGIGDLVPFMRGSEGFAWWFIMMKDQNDYRIVYRDLPYGEFPDKLEDKELGEYFICSDCFEEFVFRLSGDLRNNESIK